MSSNNSPPFNWSWTYESILDNWPQDNPCIMELRNILDHRYHMTLKVSEFGSYWVWINGVHTIRRMEKFWPVTFSDNCKLIFGTPTKVWWSIKYPTPGFEEWYCIIEVITDSFPHMDLDLYRNKIEILSLKKI